MRHYLSVAAVVGTLYLRWNDFLFLFPCMLFPALVVVVLHFFDKWMRLAAYLAVLSISLFLIPPVGLTLARCFHPEKYKPFLTFPESLNLELICFGIVGVLLGLTAFFVMVKLSWWLILRRSPSFPYFMPRES